MTTDRLAALTAYDCWGLLAEAELARVAWQGPDEIGLVPVNYAVVDGALWLRTEPDSALAREAGDGPVVIEVDHVDPAAQAGWSVVVRGTAELVDALDVPDMLVEMRVWPGGDHSLFVRVEPSRVTGRRLWGDPPAEGDRGDRDARA